MSRAHPEGIDIAEAGIVPGTGDHQYPPQLAQNQASQGVSNFVDGSGPIFSMYLEMATEEDKKMAEAWQADADGILIFTGLFSAAVASLISVSIQDIRQNPQDTSNFYLSNIYQTLADPNRSDISSSLPASPPPFSPPNYAVWVNALLFLSLVISISCALLATLLQQWARRYLKVTQPRYSLHKRARIRAFFFEGVDKFLLPWAVEALPTLLHVSLFLFFAGISVFLWNVNLTIFKSVVSWIGICTALYGCITFIPIFRHDSPYHTPLSLPAWHIVAGIQLVTFRILQWFTISTLFIFPCLCFGPLSLIRFAEKAYRRFQSLEESHRKLLVQGMRKTVEKTSLNSPSAIDTRAFLWTFDSLDEDHELERFFSGLPGFRGSKLVDDPLPSLTGEQTLELSMALIGLLDRTFASDLLSHQVKRRRAVVCAKAIDPTDTSKILFWRIFNRILSEDQYGPVQSAEIAHLVRGWGEGKDEGTTAIIQAIVIGIIARARRRDDSWFILASNELGVPESVLRDYPTQGDSLSLAILTHITRHQFSHFQEASWPIYAHFRVLGAASRFDVQNTSPEQQHEFCALWNQIVLKAQNDDDSTIAGHILTPIRKVYVTLHRDTDAAPTAFSASTSDSDDVLWLSSSYPLCNIPGHHSDPILHVHNDSASATFARTSPNDDGALPPASLASPDAPTSSVPASLQVHALNGLTDVPLPDNFDPVHQATIESLRIPVISPDPATSGAIPDIVTSVISLSDPTPATSTPTPSLSFASLPAAVCLQHNAETSLDAPNIPSSASANPVIDNILPTEPHSSMIVTPAPSTSPGPTSAPDVGAMAKDDGRPQLGLRKQKDTPGILEVDQAIHANSMANLDPPPPPLMRSITKPEVAIAGPSPREPDHDADHPPHISHGRYDMV